MKLTHAKLIVMNKMVSYLFTGGTAMTVRELTVAVPAFVFIGLRDGSINHSQMDKLTDAPKGLNEKARIVHYSKWIIRGLLDSDNGAKKILSTIANAIRKEELDAIKHLKESATDTSEAKHALTNSLYEIFLGSHKEVENL